MDQLPYCVKYVITVTRVAHALKPRAHGAFIATSFWCCPAIVGPSNFLSNIIDTHALSVLLDFAMRRK